MPTISFFYGIYILMYVNEDLPPHFHARYEGQEVLIAIQTGKLLKDNSEFPRRALRLIEEWRELHVQELMQDWEDAMQLKLPKPIPPLK